MLSPIDLSDVVRLGFDVANRGHPLLVNVFLLILQKYRSQSIFGSSTAILAVRRLNPRHCRKATRISHLQRFYSLYLCDSPHELQNLPDK